MENIALRLFHVGFDTFEIAYLLGIPESQALEQVSSQRSAMLGLSDPYAVAPVSSRIIRTLSQHIQSSLSSAG